MTSPSEIEILAKTIYGEARGEYPKRKGGLMGLIAVGNVVMNRVNTPDRFGNDIRSVCLKPLQFSCWNEGDRNRLLLNHEKLKNDSIYKVCIRVAQHVSSGDWPDLTKGSNHYHAYHIRPKWAHVHDLRAQIGRHWFYKLRVNGYKKPPNDNH